MIVELKSKEKVIYAEIMTFLSKMRNRETYFERIHIHRRVQKDMSEELHNPSVDYESFINASR